MDPSAEGNLNLEALPDAAVDADAVEGGAARGERSAALASLPAVLPVLPVRNMVVFPGTVVPMAVAREKSKRLLDAVFAGDKLLAVCAQRHAETEDPTIDDVYRVGTAARALKLLRSSEDTHTILVFGLVRVGIEEFVAMEPYWQAKVNPRPDSVEPGVETEALMVSARRLAEQVIELSPNVPEEAQAILRSIDEPAPLADFLAANLSLDLVQKQELLETFDVHDRLRKVAATLTSQYEVLSLAQKIQTDVKGQIEKTQREYYLHEQMRAIRKELGENEDAELDEVARRVEAARMPEPVAKEARREFERLRRIPSASPERGLIRDYLDWLCEMPWTEETRDKLDLDEAQRVLDEDHYGLEKIKRRLVEHLAVRKLKPDGKGPILCFVGPPGVGKTSLGQSIARAMDRRFIRIALGGVRDEADIRGHRRTYIGAIPGRIVQEMRKAGTRNPVLMLDEIDKLGADFRGDPAAALLEVLDPAQNATFTDHYLGVPFDLSKVLFITTANYLEPVAPALRDRMEVIELPGYTTAEKLEIARRYLVRRQANENGLAEAGVTFEDDALRAIIESYTREAGVRNLERSIGTVLRGLAARVARGERAPSVVRADGLEEFLGPIRFEPEVAARTAIPGVATGMAYTPLGGELIFVEAMRVPGRGAFSLTGQLGDVMRESAQAALTLVRAHSAEWGIPAKALTDADIHVHVPAGGVPKDGPSAGVAMLTAMVSLLVNRAVDPRVAMTGEITLRGLVLPIGGLKEKVLAAHRGGIATVILPARNRRDLVDVPRDVQSEVRFIFVETVAEVLAAAIPGLAGPGRKRRRSRAAARGRRRHRR